MSGDTDDLRAILAAYKTVMDASWPTLHPAMAERVKRWPSASQTDLEAELVGLDDFDRRLPWGHQAAKYRLDDEAVFASGSAKLDILERQQSATGITWVRAGNAPIRQPTGDVIGIFGMYELLDAEAGRKLFAERNIKRRK